MDEDAPPRKMSKPDTFFKQNHDAVLEKCRETLAKYGISGNFETSTNLDTVPNEVIVALAFGVFSTDGMFTCLGIKQVAEKSAQTAITALEAVVSQLPEAPTDLFKKFIIAVRSTISDSARTEVKFNDLLQSLRNEAIPGVMENYEELSESEKTEISKFSQYFCQLHVVSNFTKVALKSLLEHELTVDGARRTDDPSAFVLIKLLWEAFCHKKSINRFTFPAFLGNRFNIVFVLASRVFFHRHHLKNLLRNVTGPLWRLAEGCDHIFETCEYALQLHVWLEECAAHPFLFFEGNSPTPNLEMNSSTNSSLLLQELVGKVSTEMGAEVVSILSRASIDYFSRAFVDFLPGGKYCNDANEVRGSSSSAPATNRNIESVFGLMSHFFDTKPNMRLDVKVAYTLLKKNHTLEWLRTLPEEDQDKILTDSRAALKMMKNASKERQIQIENDILHQMKLKNQNATKKQAKLLSDRTNATHEVLRKLIIQQTAPYPKFFNASVGQKQIQLEDLVQKLQLLFRTYNKNQLIVLNHHEYIGKKFEEMLTNRRRSSTSLKRGFVQDIRLSGRQKIVSLKYEDDEDTFERELSIFEEELSNGIVIFIN
uniref:Uncharacterized protein n=1 Tax=Caenorhabditis japonica TaxID=281687 RepID=A0A8R1IFU8_CAEJA